MAVEQASPEQIQRWRDLSAALATHWSITLTPARREKLVDYVIDCIDTIVDEAGWEGERRKLGDWDGNGGTFYVGDRVTDYLFDRRVLLEGKTSRNGDYIGDSTRGRLGNHVSCCIRAGFDVAIRPSGGVIGFTIGDLRRACGGVLPPWVRAFFDAELLLDDLDDAEGLWL